MDKDIKPYKQRGETCAIACLMMALEYYKKIEKANWYVNLSKKGLNTTIYHSEKDCFTNKNKALSDLDFEYAMKEYKEYLNIAKSLGTEIKNGIIINTELIKEELKKDNLVILAGKLSGGYHAILISGYDNNKFIVCDPLYKNKQEKTETELEKFMNTGIGKWFISVNNKKVY
ncbi:MAG: hypothetical protein E7163_04800 [Firmicutes bacterium]|nr:hypothetical protein [Bacillota bacterium]